MWSLSFVAIHIKSVQLFLTKKQMPRLKLAQLQLPAYRNLVADGHDRVRLKARFGTRPPERYRVKTGVRYSPTWIRKLHIPNAGILDPENQCLCGLQRTTWRKVF